MNAATTDAAITERASAFLWAERIAKKALTIGQENARTAIAPMSRFSTLFAGLDWSDSAIATFKATAASAKPSATPQTRMGFSTSVEATNGIRAIPPEVAYRRNGTLPVHMTIMDVSLT